MARKVPAHLEGTNIENAPINYEWSNEIGLRLYGGKDQNVKLYKAIDSCSFKARMALGVALSEWGVYRLRNYISIEDAQNRLEAAWASAVNPIYAKSLRYKLSRSADLRNPEIQAPLELALCLLGETHAHYATGSLILAEPVVKQAMLARYVNEKKSVFEEWLSNSVRRATEVFPRQSVEDDKSSEKYDASHEVPVPREFFEPGFIYTPEAGKRALQEFLKTLDYTKNPYLRSLGELKEKGFQGTPYGL
jgi:hypothetical protein